MYVTLILNLCFFLFYFDFQSFIIMLNLLHSHRNQKLLKLKEILQSNQLTNILDFEKNCWIELLNDVEILQKKNNDANIISKTLHIEDRVSLALMSIQQKLKIDHQIYLACENNQFEQKSQDEQQQQLTLKNIKHNSISKPLDLIKNQKQLSLELKKLKETLQVCEKQNTQLMKRLVKSLQRCSMLIEKVDLLKKQNSYLQVQDSNSMKYYQRLLLDKKRELKQKDDMIRMYELKLQMLKGQQSQTGKLTSRHPQKGYAYSSQGIMDRIQSLRALASGKIKHRSNGTQLFDAP